MAGSFKHVVDTETDKNEWSYRGMRLLDNRRDDFEAIEEMAFMLLYIKKFQGEGLIEKSLKEFYRCIRGEREWPDFMEPGIKKGEIGK